MELKSLIKDKKVSFVRAQDNSLWYEVNGTDFEYPIPFEETKGGVFKDSDKAIFHMRWIRRHFEENYSSGEDQ